MAGVNSVSSSSSSSIYGSRNANILSGLASGLDTEGMIEQLVQSYSQKITSLQQKNTKYTWQQESIQGISNKLVEFSRKYMSMSYGSATNLSSSAFFDKAVTTEVLGDFANKVSASGKCTSNIELNGVAQLATAARYTTEAAHLMDNVQTADGKTTLSTSALKMGDVTVSTLAGKIELMYGTNQKVELSFAEDELFGVNDDGTGALDTEKFKTAIEEKLAEQTVTVGSKSYKASDVFRVEVDSAGKVSFADALGAGNAVKIESIELGDITESDGASFTLGNAMTAPTKSDVNMVEYLSDKSISFTLDGKQKVIKFDDLDTWTDTNGQGVVQNGQFSSSQFVNYLQKKLDDADIGDKIKVGSSQGGGLSFTIDGDSRLSVSSSAGDVLGIGENGITSYFSTNLTLKDVFDQSVLNNLRKADIKNEKGEVIKTGYELTIGGKQVGVFTEDSSIQDVMNAINSSEDSNVKVSYSTLTNKFVLEAKETGADGEISLGASDLNGKNDLALELFGSKDQNGKYEGIKYDEGKDAVYKITVNGDTLYRTSSTNTVELDGLTVTFEGTFNASGKTVETLGQNEGLDALFSVGDAVTFKTSSDTDTIISTVKDMVNEYNTIMEEVKKLYSTMPLQTSSGKSYEPLTDEDMEDMSDSAIQKYEEKAKTGLLFMDRDLSSLYSAMRNAITGNSAAMKAIGLSTSYEDGLTTLTLDESALKEALQSDPDSVKNFFVGDGENGFMNQIKEVTERYAATTGATKGILIERAGSKYAPTSSLQNTILTQMNEIDKQIEKWQDKLSSQVTYYTKQFTRLETLMNEMNSQSSALAGLMGY